MSKRKRNNENIPSNSQIIFDDSFQKSGEIQQKKLKKFKATSRCKKENNYIHIPVTNQDGEIIYDGNHMRTIETNIAVNNCF